MKIENFSADDRKNALDQSKRGKRFSLINQILTVVMVVIVILFAQSKTSKEPMFNYSHALFWVSAYFALFISFSIGFYQSGIILFKLSKFGLKPKQQDLLNYKAAQEARAEKEIKTIEAEIKRLSEKKQKAEAVLA